MAREIKLITPEYVEDYLTIYLNAYPAYKNVGEEGRNKYRPRILNSMENDQNIHFYGLFQDGKLIAQMKLIDFTMNAFGALKKATGLMALGVHPMYKKQGAAKDMVRFFEEYTRKSGAIVSMLLPFRIDFYRNMGYGYGSRMETFEIPTINLPKAPKDLLKNICFMGSDDVSTKEILDCYKEFVKLNHGMVDKFEDEVRDYYGDSDTRRVGYYEKKILKGYVTYDMESASPTNYTLNRINVKEIVYLNEEALTGLLGFLRNQSDLGQTITIRTGEPDFYHILPSAQNISGNYSDFGFLETNTASVGTMYKISDPAFFISETKDRTFIPVNLKAKFIFENELEHKLQEINVEFEDGHWKVGSLNTQVDVTINLSLSTLSSLFMGSAGFASLVRLGSIKVDNPEMINTLDQIFYVSQKPWTNTDY